MGIKTLLTLRAIRQKLRVGRQISFLSIDWMIVGFKSSNENLSLHNCAGCEHVRMCSLIKHAYFSLNTRLSCYSEMTKDHRF